MQIRRTWLLTIALMSGIVLAACGHPSDASMEKRFVTHESELLAMSKEDLRVARIPAENRNDVMKPPESGLTEQRWENYRSRFQKTGLEGGIDRTPDYPTATFFVASFSSMLHGPSKGYMYSDVPLSPVVAPLDGKLPPEVAPTAHGLFAFKHIKSNWYLYYYE